MQADEARSEGKLVNRVMSSDGTRITFEKVGDGSSVIVVGGRPGDDPFAGRVLFRGGSLQCLNRKS